MYIHIIYTSKVTRGIQIKYKNRNAYIVCTFIIIKGILCKITEILNKRMKEK